MAMSQEEEHELVLRAQVGDREALKRLVKAHEPAIRQLAGRHRCRGLEEGDQVHNGVVAFIANLRRFDPDLGVRLWTFTRHAVRGAMIEACRQQAGLSDQGRKHYRCVIDTYEQLQQALLREPTVDEVAQAGNVPVKVVKELFVHWQGRTVPLPEEDEENEEGVRHIVPPALQTPSPEYEIVRTEEVKSGCEAATQHLTTNDGVKFLVLAILHEKDPAGYTEGYEWSAIAEMLADPAWGPNPPWEQVRADFPHLSGLPTTWPQVCALFQYPPPLLTENALKQWYSRMKRRLVGSLG